MNKTDGLIMADGNTAAAIGSIFGGVQFAAWYPITPASSLAEALNDYLPMLRKREDGKHTYAVVQAEDELAAIGMAIGAGWSGLRSMTSTSGPGLSLMTEFAGWHITPKCRSSSGMCSASVPAPACPPAPRRAT
jgi:2-oxoglutarate/2-oxoacid ferredoxin oxidoreductase subunit alpha